MGIRRVEPTLETQKRVEKYQSLIDLLVTTCRSCKIHLKKWCSFAAKQIPHQRKYRQFQQGGPPTSHKWSHGAEKKWVTGVRSYNPYQWSYFILVITVFWAHLERPLDFFHNYFLLGGIRSHPSELRSDQAPGYFL